MYDTRTKRCRKSKKKSRKMKYKMRMWGKKFKMKRGHTDTNDENKKPRQSDRLQGYLGHTDVGGVGTASKGSYKPEMDKLICKAVFVREMV